VKPASHTEIRTGAAAEADSLKRRFLIPLLAGTSLYS
jgi:hypothetical protein